MKYLRYTFWSHKAPRLRLAFKSYLQTVTSFRISNWQHWSYLIALTELLKTTQMDESLRALYPELERPQRRPQRYGKGYTRQEILRQGDPFSLHVFGVHKTEVNRKRFELTVGEKVVVPLGFEIADRDSKEALLGREKVVPDIGIVPIAPDPDLYQSDVRHIKANLNLLEDTTGKEKRNLAWEIAAYDHGTYVVNSFSLLDNRLHPDYNDHRNIAEVTLEWRDGIKDEKTREVIDPLSKGLFVTLRRMGDASYTRSTLILIPYDKTFLDFTNALDWITHPGNAGEITFTYPRSRLQTKISYCPLSNIVSLACKARAEGNLPEHSSGLFMIYTKFLNVLVDGLVTSVGGEPMKLLFNKDFGGKPPRRKISNEPREPIILGPTCRSDFPGYCW